MDIDVHPANWSECIWGKLVQARSSLRWPSVMGTVTGSGTKTQSSLRGGPATAADVRYMYEVDGKRFEGTRISFGQYGTGDGGHARKEAEKYPVGKPVTVYYDPNSPATAVLEPAVGALTSSPDSCCSSAFP